MDWLQPNTIYLVRNLMIQHHLNHWLKHCWPFHVNDWSNTHQTCEWYLWISSVGMLAWIKLSCFSIRKKNILTIAERNSKNHFNITSKTSTKIKRLTGVKLTTLTFGSAAVLFSIKIPFLNSDYFHNLINHFQLLLFDYTLPTF